MMSSMKEKEKNKIALRIFVESNREINYLLHFLQKIFRAGLQIK
ncbi:hypothetical protein XSR1_80008 [Xenorhabdus szentirmaii DSM 16338]|uniref:Uncharacterized protein n=1 Tax=Xenorhabdus szentirmaii DSM 16338 TaxID=1427518 RepID=W1J420_9GAMM|nr:hypothetical protein XSR1_80008 [Xenorhabdus szentirmaii DSM 16338]